MKKLKKLAVKKVTLRDLDDPALDAVSAGNVVGPHSVVGRSDCVACGGSAACAAQKDRW